MKIPKEQEYISHLELVAKMSNDVLSIAISKKLPGHESREYFADNRYCYGGPNYANDLNAMHTAITTEAQLWDAFMEKYIRILELVIFRTKSRRREPRSAWWKRMLTATARQQAEAFVLATLGY